MGILRADRITGLGGANAINGSTFFGGGGSSDNHLIVNGADTEFGTSGSFTMEFWMNPIGSEQGSGTIGLTAITDPRTSDSSVHPLIWISGGFGGKANDVLYYYAGGSDRIVGTTVLQRNTWYHVAVVRTGGTTTMYLDGSSEGSFSDSLDYAANNGFYIGQRYTSTTYNFNGHISNFRLIKGTALYTGTFTPPTTRLTKTSNTEILCCNSASDVTNDETGKVIIVGRSSTNRTGPVASKFTPNSPVGLSTTTDVGSQYGLTFDGFGSFATSTYMVPPGGNTRERNRGRALWMGGYAPSNYRTMIDFVNIQSTGNAQDFGELSATGLGEGSECSSSTRAIQGGGSLINTMEFVTIANTSNTTDFGDLTVSRRSLDALSNDTRGIWGGGTTNPAMSDVIDFATIATTGNATDFGNLTVGRRNVGTVASPTRGVFAGGNPGSSPLLDDTMDYITIGSAGNAIDFGNLSAAFREGSGCSNGTRGVFNVGGPGSGSVNTMEFITIATTGNTTDYGDLFYAVGNAGGTSNGTRGVFGGGAGAAYTNIIQFITISTLGDAADFGDLTFTRIPYGATSDSHGGLS